MDKIKFNVMKPWTMMINIISWKQISFGDTNTLTVHSLTSDQIPSVTMKVDSYDLEPVKK